MKFEFDTKKSAVNEQKHGIDFIAAQELWNDLNLLEVPALSTDEMRYLVIGQIAGRHWSAIITYRDDAIRLISVRRARKEEIEHYEST